MSKDFVGDLVNIGAAGYSFDSPINSQIIEQDQKTNGANPTLIGKPVAKTTID